jgi:hypothetical protein
MSESMSAVLRRPAGERTDLRAEGADTLLELALRDLALSAGRVSVYTALLEAHLADEPAASPLHEIVCEVRSQAHQLLALLDEVRSK